MENNDSQILQIDGVSLEDNIAPEVQGEVPLEVLESDVDEDYSPVTPEQKIGLQAGKDDISETFLGSESGSSDFSNKEGSETMFSSSSSSSSDAESGTYNVAVKKYLLQHDNGDDILKPKIIEAEDSDVNDKENLHLGKEVGGEGLLMMKIKSVQYEELLEQVANYEIELKFAKKKLQSKQDEIAQLKYENLTLVEELDRTIEKVHTSEDHMAKMEEKFRNELQNTQHQLQGQLDQANQSIGLLQTELGSERKLVSELQEMLTKTTNDVSDYGCQIDELKLALLDAQQGFSQDRSKFELEITHLHEQRDVVEASLKKAEQRNRFLEEQIRHYELEKDEVRTSHEAREMGLLDEIRQLKAEMTHSQDANKLKYDLLLADKDQVFAKLQTLHAELNHRGIHIEQMEDRISKLSAENEGLIEESRKSQKLAEELKMKAADQEKELEKQRTIISDRAEEKREAIRQLCFSLEHYRDGYHQLRQAFIKHKRPAVLAL